MKIFCEFLKREEVALIFDVLESAGGEDCVRFVGGCVRNGILGIAINDVDLATTLTPDQVEAALKDHNIDTIPLGKAYGTIGAVINSALYEITSLRKDVATDGRYAEVVFGQDWTEDALRRDFTINALYCDRFGQVYDPTGEGIKDINARVVRFIGDPHKRIEEDYLRILRFFRFSAQFSINIDVDSSRACGKLKRGILSLSSERIWAELQKILSLPDPAHVVKFMNEQGVLSIMLSFPSDALCALDSFCFICRTSDDPLLRFIALLYGFGCNEAEAVKPVAMNLKLSKAQYNRMNRCLETFSNLRALGVNIDQFPAENETKASKRLLYLSGSVAMSDALHLLASITNKTAYLNDWLKLANLSLPRFPLAGRDLIALGMLPGPAIKVKLSEIETQWIAAGFDDQVIKLELSSIRESFAAEKRSGR